MNLTPNENFYIYTKLTPAQVQAKLDELIGVNNYQYTGYAADGIFKIQPIINPQYNAPEIEGIVEEASNGSRISVRIQTRKNIWMIMLIWAAVMLFAGILSTISLFTSKSSHNSVFPWFLVLLIYIPFMSNFQAQGKKAKDALVNTFEGVAQSA